MSLVWGEKLTPSLGGRFQIKKLKEQLGERRTDGRLDALRPEDGVFENGTDVHVMDLQSKPQPSGWHERCGVCGLIASLCGRKVPCCPPAPHPPEVLPYKKHGGVFRCETEQEGRVGGAGVLLCKPKMQKRCPHREAPVGGAAGATLPARDAATF